MRGLLFSKMLTSLASQLGGLSANITRKPFPSNQDETDELLSKDKSEMIEERWIVIRVPSTGLRHFTGISSSYSTQYNNIMQGVITQTEFVEIIERLNETIRDYWPCDTCYYFGYGCALCTFGLSVLLPHYCATHSETYATAMLRNVTLKSRFYDRRISFRLIKKCCQSFIEIKIPFQYINNEALEKYHNDPNISVISTTVNIFSDDIEQDQPPFRVSTPIGVSDIIDRTFTGNVEIGPFIRPPSLLHSSSNIPDSSLMSPDKDKKAL